MGYQYSKGGRHLDTFYTTIPSTGGVTLLDVIYLPGEMRFVVLDMMMWNGYSFYECDTECRFSLLKSKLAESEGVKESTDENPYPFHALRSYDCDRATIERVMTSEMDFGGGDECGGHLDGLLFYHKDLH